MRDGAEHTAEPDETTGVGAHRAEPAASTGRSKTPVVLALVAVVALLLAGLVFVLTRGGSDDQPSGADPGVYVDDSHAQEHEAEVAPGESVGEMSLSVDGETAPVDPVQLTDQGALIPPQDVHRLGWYSASAVPGADGPVGSSVITGHVNFQGQGEGFAARFAELKEGEELTVTVDGEQRRFRVTQPAYRLTKGAELPEVVNDTDGPNRLVLITCGGEFVGGQLGYADNIIAVAEPD